MGSQFVTTNTTIPGRTGVGWWGGGYRDNRFPFIGEGLISWTDAPHTDWVYKKSKYANVTPQYFTKVKSGEFIPSLGYTLVVERKVPATGHGAHRNMGLQVHPYYGEGWNWVQNKQPGAGNGFDSTPYIVIPSSELASLEQLAQFKSRLKIGDQKAGLGEDFAQYKQTVGLFTGNTMKIIRALAALKKGDIRGAMASLGLAPRKRLVARFSKAYAVSPAKAIASFWLELQYGWKPLVQDIYGVSEALHERLNTRDFLYRAVTRKTRVWTYSGRGAYPLYHNLHYSKRTKYTVQFVVYYKVLDRELRTLEQLGIINPVELAWNLIPYSFVVDWLFPIGDWLQTLTATLGLKFVDGCKSTMLEEFASTHAFGHQLEDPEHHDTYEFDAYGSNSKFTFVRTVLSDWPAVVAPQIKNPVSRAHLLNAMALLTNLLKQR